MMTFFFGDADAAIDIAGLDSWIGRSQEEEDAQLYTSPSQGSAGAALTPPTP
jgi:hypothetical protein